MLALIYFVLMVLPVIVGVLDIFMGAPIWHSIILFGGATFFWIIFTEPFARFRKTPPEVAPPVLSWSQKLEKALDIAPLLKQKPPTRIHKS